MTTTLKALAALALLITTGCQATYTSIRRDDDTTYYITRTKQNPFAAWGTLFRCAATKDARQLKCGTIGEP